ncbi:MAG: hypothetical protein HWQ36_26240 [Nostoc sp. NMS2]|uniref:hypothetical protein n=1 Tax=Nostoc sp. NMS2 TaxID=2815389 RepID=UPI0025E7F82C|nr:hypothetical protein [Nostoc sp. NMS2]MBN3993888.1 hypothetical protein [Nostoc sp. NMS2]
MKYLNQHFLPSDCDVHFALLRVKNAIPNDLSIKSVRALLSEYGATSEKYADEWRNIALSLRIRGAFENPLTIADVANCIKLIKEVKQ